MASHGGPDRDEQIGMAEDRLHILDGLVRALDDPHGLLDLLLEADDVAVARRRVQESLGLSEIQAMAVLDLQLRQAPREQQRRIIAQRDENAAILASLRGES